MKDEEIEEEKKEVLDKPSEGQENEEGSDGD